MVLGKVMRELAGSMLHLPVTGPLQVDLSANTDKPYEDNGNLAFKDISKTPIRNRCFGSHM